MQQIEAMYKPMEELGKQQEELGRQQEELGKQQEALGRQQEQASVPTPDMRKEMAEITDAMAKLQAKMGKSITQDELGDLQGKLGDLQGRLGELQGEIGDKQGEFGEQQGKLGEQQGKLGAEQGRLGEEQGRLAMKADQKVRSRSSTRACRTVKLTRSNSAVGPHISDGRDPCLTCILDLRDSKTSRSGDSVCRFQAAHRRGGRTASTRTRCSSSDNRGGSRTMSGSVAPRPQQPHALDRGPRGMVTHHAADAAAGRVDDSVDDTLCAGRQMRGVARLPQPAVDAGRME